MGVIEDYDEMEGMKKLEKQIQRLTDVFSKLGDKVQTQQIMQHAKIYAQKKKGLELDQQHHDLRMKQIQEQKRSTIEAFAERQKEIRQTKLLTKSMKDQISTYDKVFRSLGGGGTSIGGAFNMMTGKLTSIAKSSKDMLDAEKAFQKKRKDTGIFDKGLKDIVRNNEKQFNIDTFNSRTLKSMAGRLSKLAEFMEKNQGKILITAGVASVLIGIISKALNVAPMFQAMFKLMQLAVNMILMPIGTFIGAMIKPFMIMVISTLAPLFQEAMQKAMEVGAAVGNFITGEGSFAAIINALLSLNNPKNPTNNPLPLPESGVDKGIDQATGLLTGTAIVASSMYAIKKIAPVIGNKVGNFFGVNNAISAKLGTPKAGSSAPIYNNQGQVVSKNTPTNPKTNTLKNIGKVALPLLLVDLLFGKTLENFFSKGVRDLTGANDDHNLVFSQGNNLSGSGLGMRDQLWKSKGQTSAFSANTPTFEAMNALTTKLGIGNNWMEDPEKVKLIGEHMQLVEGVWRIGGADMEKVGGILEDIGQEIVPMAKQHMIEMTNQFKFMEGMGYSMSKTLSIIADNFGTTSVQIEARLKQMNIIGTKKTPSYKAPTTSSSSSGYSPEIDTTGSSGFFGVNNAMVAKSLEVPKTSLQIRKEAAAKAAIEEFNKRNTGSYDSKGKKISAYDSIYGGSNSFNDGTDGSGRGYTMGSSSAGQKILNAVNAQKQLDHLALVSSGLLGNTVNSSNANGGQISEPVFGIGRSGRTYSFGEHGAETITPNGQSGGGGITINIARIEKNADFEQLKPMIQKWILEANSRRGMI